jgi:hypothetical protein
MDAWKFPVGTKVWKEFRFGGKLVETRLMWKRSATSWEVGTYIWNDANTSATLNTATKGTVLPSGYEIPTVKDCDKCHHGGSDKILGLEAVAMGLPTAEGATLSSLAQRGLLSHPPRVTTAKLPEDATGKAAAALGYLHVNCGMACHSTRGIGQETNLVLRVRASEVWSASDMGMDPTASDAGAAHTYPYDASQTDAVKAMLNTKPKTGAIAAKFPDQARVTPGAHDQSLVWTLSHRRDFYQMPPLVSHVIDESGAQTLADWIDALSTTTTQ